MTDLTSAALMVLAGIGAGTINSIVGSGSLITFPTLLLLGYPPIVANVSNTVAMVPGALSAAFAYRRELAGQRSRAVPLIIAGALGGLTGGLLLLALPDAAFEMIVPVLILVACGLVAAQPRLSRWITNRRLGTPDAHSEGGAVLPVLVYLTGIYGGYFGAAQGVILVAVLAILVTDDLRRLNALKVVVTGTVNGVAAILFLLVAHVDIRAAVMVAIGATIGGVIGAKIGRRLSPVVLRAAIIIVGLIVAIRLLVH